MKILDLKLTNFKKFSNLPNPTITFNKNINVLVGANNAGKTSVLKAIQKLFSTENIDVANDANYLIKDGNLVFEANVQISAPIWLSFLSIAAGQIQQPANKSINLVDFSESLEKYSINIKHNITYVNRAIVRNWAEGKIKENINEFLEELNLGGQLPAIAINSFVNANLYAVYKTPLFLDSKGQIKETEYFVPLKQIEENSNKNDIDIRGLLYALKKKEPVKFNDFKKRLLEIFTELDDVDVIHNEDFGRFELVLKEKLQKNGDTEQVTYDITNVGQGMQTLVQMFSKILLLNPSIVLMDEPEVHMHPALIKEFIRYVKILSEDIQFIITTHSVVLMNEVGIENLFILKNEIEQKGVVVEKVKDNKGILSAVNLLGYEVDALIYTLKPKVFVFTEGPSDKDILLDFAKKMGLEKAVNSTTIGFVPLGGKGDRFKMSNLINKLNQEYLDIPILMILDRDETPPEKIEEIRTKYFADNPKRLHYLNKRQIENYLIEPEAIKFLVSSKIKDVELKDKWNEFELVPKFYELANIQKEDIYNKFLREIFLKETLINALEFENIIKPLLSLPLNGAVTKFVGAITGKIAENAYEFSQKTNTAIQEFEQVWDKEKLEMCDGRKLIKRFRDFVANEFFVYFDNHEIIDFMKVVPPEIAALINRISKPDELKIAKKD